uniref:Uncharacterized protein n=1 Tax=Alexandrium catenella TaxID=2925 RepID=A0A7S1QVI3_ALECA
MTPERFGGLLRDGVRTGEIAFTARADGGLVVEQYRKAFHRAFAETRDLMYQTLKWPDDKILELAEALAYARAEGLLEKTSMVRIWGNAWTEVGRKAVEESIKGLGITLCAT